MRVALPLFVIIAVPLVALAAADKVDDQVKKVVDQFAAAVKAEDVDAVMKVVDVPWFDDGKRIIRERDELKKHFQEIFKEKDLTTFTYEIDEVNRFGDIQGEVSEQDRELLKGVVDKDDRVVSLTIKQGDKKHKVHLGVRLRKGEAKIVGLKD